MLYDLGKVSFVRSSAQLFLLVAGAVSVVAFVCISLAMAVRLGNAIIGW